MKVRYTAIFKMHGANKLPGDEGHAHFLTLSIPNLTATLVKTPDACFLHVDKSGALGAQLLKGIFAPDHHGTLQERVAAEIEGIKSLRHRNVGPGIFLVFEGETDIPPPELKHRRDADGFSICFDAIAKDEIRDVFRPSVQSVIGALSLSLPKNVSHQIEKCGDVVYLVDDATGKPIYTFTFGGGAMRGSVSSPLMSDTIVEAASLATKIAANTKMTRPTSLLTTSLEKATGELQGFIAAWAALEIFVNAAFKADYEARLFTIIEDSAPTSSRPVFDRLKEVMKDKYRLSDKFVVIASVLDGGSAADDVAKFKRLKEIRDGLLHALDTPSSSLPTDEAQMLLLKYMKLHLTSTG